MFTDVIHPRGWENLFRALNEPCACERTTKKHINRGRPYRTCKRVPLPHPGFRWYREAVTERIAA